MSKQISVIIPVYNVEKYLSRCLNSVIEQTYRNLEIILIDDGSPDSSSRICDEYASKDNRIKVIHKKNGGLSSARNAGLAVCSGDYIFFIDSDDWLVDENVLLEFIETAEKNSADICYGLFNIATESDVKPKTNNNRYSDASLFLYSNPHFFSAWNKLYKRRLLPFLHFTNGRIHEDVDIIPRLTSEADKIVKLQKYTYNYYQNEASLTRSHFSQKRFDMFLSVDSALKITFNSKLKENCLKENLFGFQIFCLYCDILRIKDNHERKEFLNQFIFHLKNHYYHNFFKFCLFCFIHNESPMKALKKTAALLWLRVLFFFYEDK